MTAPTSSAVVAWLQGACAGALLALRIAAVPSAAHRPRFARNGSIYYERSFAEWLGESQRQLAMQTAGKAPLAGQLVCMVETLVEKPRTTKRTSPLGDVDNFAKGALDGATKAGVWRDDGQIVLLVSTKRWAEPGEQPGAIIHVGEVAC